MGSATFSANVIWDANDVIHVAGGATLTLSSDLALPSGSSATVTVDTGGTLDPLTDVVNAPIGANLTLTMNVAGTATVSRRIIANTTLTKTNTGVLTLDAHSTHNGPTEIQAGTVFINGTQEHSQSEPGGRDAGWNRHSRPNQRDRR